MASECCLLRSKFSDAGGGAPGVAWCVAGGGTSGCTFRLRDADRSGIPSAMDPLGEITGLDPSPSGRSPSELAVDKGGFLCPPG